MDIGFAAVSAYSSSTIKHTLKY